MPEDRDFATERIILCHVLKRSNCPHQPLESQQERECKEDIKRMTNKERRKHCASGARTMMSLNAEKRRGRPPKVKPKDEKEESKTVSEIESEFDYRCKSAN